MTLSKPLSPMPLPLSTAIAARQKTNPAKTPRHQHRLALCLAASSSWAQTSNDISSAYFDIGFESLNYSENITIGGQTVETDAWTTNPIQRSDRYIAVGDKKSFYI